MAHQRGQVRVGVRQRQHVAARGGRPQLGQPALGQHVPRAADGAPVRGGDPVAVAVGHVRDGLHQVGVEHPGQAGALLELAAGVQQPVQAAAGLQLGGQRVVGEDAACSAAPVPPTSGHNQLNPVGTKSWVLGTQGSRVRVNASRPGSASPGPRAPTTSMPSAYTPNPVSVGTSSSGCCRSNGVVAPGGEVGQGGLDHDLALAAGDAPAHHRVQLGPAVEPGVGEPDPDHGVVHRLVAAVGDRPGDVQRGADGRARASGW